MEMSLQGRRRPADVKADGVGVEQKADRHRDDLDAIQKNIAAFVGSGSLTDTEVGRRACQLPPGRRPASGVPFDLDRFEHQPVPFAMNENFLDLESELFRQPNGLAPARPKDLGWTPLTFRPLTNSRHTKSIYQR